MGAWWRAMNYKAPSNTTEAPRHLCNRLPMILIVVQIVITEEKYKILTPKWSLSSKESHTVFPSTFSSQFEPAKMSDKATPPVPHQKTSGSYRGLIILSSIQTLLLIGILGALASIAAKINAKANVRPEPAS